MRWIIKHGNILDEPADVLICSANVFLNLSGGVGGEILLRYGDEMQRQLHRYLADRLLRFVPQGIVVPCGPCGTPYQAVLHAVAVDGGYDSSPLVIETVVSAALAQAASLGAEKVALTALATGYGRMSLLDFARGLAPLLEVAFPPVEVVALCLRNHRDVAELAAALPTAQREGPARQQVSGGC